MAGFSAITWTNGVTAINQTNMQRYDDWIQQIEGDAGSVALSGSTSGTATLYQILQGTIKISIIRLSNFRNGGGSAQTITLPVAYTQFAIVESYDMPSWQLLSGGAARQFNYFSSISASGFGTSTITTFNASDIIARTGGSGQGFDTISFNASYPSAKDAHAIIIGM